MHFDDLNRIRVLDEDTASQVDTISCYAFLTTLQLPKVCVVLQDHAFLSERDHICQAQELREVCQDFLGDIGDFQKIADSFIVIFDAVSKEVETEKMKVGLEKDQIIINS